MTNDPIPTSDPADLDDDPLADRTDSIFARRELLRIGHVPESDRIVGRDEELIFHPYNAGQIQDILNKICDEFASGVLAKGVIPKVAALAAKEHGDARKAIEILASAGKIASRNGDGRVTENHVTAAQDVAEMSRFQELVRGSTPHSKYALSALAYLHKSTLKEAFSTGEIYRAYEDICETMGTDPLSHQRVLELLKEWAFSGVTEHRHTGGGKSEGSYREHTLLRDPDMGINTVFSESRTKFDIINNL